MDKEDVEYIYSRVFLSHKNEILPFARTWMDLEGIMLSEVSHIPKDKYQKISPNVKLRNKTNQQQKKSRTKSETFKYREQAGGCQSRESGGWVNG